MKTTCPETSKAKCTVQGHGNGKCNGKDKGKFNDRNVLQPVETEDTSALNTVDLPAAETESAVHIVHSSCN